MERETKEGIKGMYCSICGKDTETNRDLCNKCSKIVQQQKQLAVNN